MLARAIQIENNLRELCDEINYELSLDFVTYDIQFGEHTFKFDDIDPNNRTDNKKRFTKLLLMDALSKTLDNILSQDAELAARLSAWDRVVQFEKMALKKEDVQSHISAESYEDLKDIARNKQDERAKLLG